MWAGVTIKTPGALPLDAAGLAARLRIDTADENELLTAFLRAAASEMEGPDGWGIALMAQTWTQTLDCFSSSICLRGWPVTGIAEIRYMDPAGAWQTVDPDDYRLVSGTDPARLLPTSSFFPWPAVMSGLGVVEIDYTLGKATPAEVDGSLVTAMAMLAGHYYENREAVIVGPTASELPLGVSHIKKRFTRVPVAG
jgi:uncharacterized phiE125 gp8 family phage protein